MDRPEPTRTDLTASLMAKVAQELQRGDERATLEAIVSQGRDVVPDADSVSVTARVGRARFETLVATSAMAEEADRSQYELDEGPCLTAARDAEWIRSGSVGGDERWRQWGPVAASLGVGSLLSVPLRADGLPAGAVNFYARRAGRFTDREEVDLALVFAAHAALAFRSAHQVAGLQVALASRHEIGAAQGVLMERYGLSLDQAFALMQRLSSHTNTKLAVIAREIVETGRVPTLDKVLADDGPTSPG